jgi:hypothetical protein
MLKGMDRAQNVKQRKIYMSHVQNGHEKQNFRRYEKG